jgi:hypothetical protein
MGNRIHKKPFGQVKKGDILYTLSYYKATIQICKIEVTEVEHFKPSKYSDMYSADIKIGYSHIYVSCDSTSYYDTYEFGKWVVTTTLDEAKKICREMTENKIKEHKKAIEAAKQKIKKWEQFKTLLDNDLYIIKQNGE